MLERLKELLGDHVRTFDTLPAGFGADELKNRLRTAPGLFVAFLGGPRRGGTSTVITATFAVFALTAQPIEAQRRQGDARTIGAYEMISIAAAALDGHVIKGVGTLTLSQVANLYAAELEAIGVALYSASFEIPLALKLPEDPAALADFLKIFVQWDVPPAQPHGDPLPADPRSVDATDDIRLPQ